MGSNIGIQEDFFSSDSSLDKVSTGIAEFVYAPKRVDVFIPNERMGEFFHKVERIQAQARKLGLPEWDVVVGEKQWRRLVNRYPVDLYPGQLDTSPLKIEGKNVSISGNAPVLEGWRFLAKVGHEKGGNLVKRMVGSDSSPIEWHTCAPNCDHCGVSRDRNNTYMLENVESGAVKQVGSTCVSDFLGGQQIDPERIAAMFDHLMDLEQDFEYDSKEFCSVNNFGVEPSVLMAATLKIVEEDGGYLSADKAEALGCLSTGNRLRSAFWSAKPIVVTPGVAHVERADQVTNWLKNQKEDESLWMRNIAYLAERHCITWKDASLFASGYVAWNRDLQKQLRNERGDGDWIGEAGGKIASRATLERVGGYDNIYGHVSVLSFRDDEGNGMVWKTQSPPNGLMVGSTYRIAGTVKAHGEYKGDKQTEVIRVKVAELELFSLGALPGFKKMATMATPDVADDRGHTPLLKAVFHDKADHAKVLLAAGADPNQLNQSKTPVLAYATSAAMAQVLLAAGARAVDVSPGDLQEMEAGARAVVVSAAPQIDEVVDAPSASLAPLLDVAKKGCYIGPVLSVADGVVTQKINREGQVARHDACLLSATVRVGSVIEVTYSAGLANVKDLSTSKSIDR